MVRPKTAVKRLILKQFQHVIEGLMNKLGLKVFFGFSNKGHQVLHEAHNICVAWVMLRELCGAYLVHFVVNIIVLSGANP